MLKSKNACAEEVELFKQMFGDSVAITPELCVSVADKFDFMWAARHLLSLAAWADYRRVTAPALADLLRGSSAIDERAWADYRRVTARTFGELFCKEE
jgi:hypothetical protein